MTAGTHPPLPHTKGLKLPPGPPPYNQDKPRCLTPSWRLLILYYLCKGFKISLRHSSWHKTWPDHGCPWMAPAIYAQNLCLRQWRTCQFGEGRLLGHPKWTWFFSHYFHFPMKHMPNLEVYRGLPGLKAHKGLECHRTNSIIGGTSRGVKDSRTRLTWTLTDNIQSTHCWLADLFYWSNLMSITDRKQEFFISEKINTLVWVNPKLPGSPSVEPPPPPPPKTDGL